MAKQIVSPGGVSITAAAAATLYHSPGYQVPNNATESLMRITHRGAGVTISKWRGYVSGNARTTTTTFTWFKNGVATSLALSVAGGVTGVVEDTTDSVSLTAGDTHSIRSVSNTEGSALTLTIRGQYQVETVGGAAPMIFETANTSVTLGASTTTYGRASTNTSNTANDRAAHDFQVAGSFSGLFGYVNFNGRSDATTFALFKNGASAISVSVAAGVTGRFEDTASSTSVAVGDDIQFRATTGAGTGTTSGHQWGSHFTPTTAGEFPSICGFQNGAPAGGAVIYQGITSNPTEAVADYQALEASTASRLSFGATVNTTTTASVARFRKNGVDGNQTVSLAAGVTGFFVDTTNTDTLAAGDLFNVKLTVGSAPDTNSRFYVEPGKITASSGTVASGAATFGGSGWLSAAGASTGISSASASLGGAGNLSGAGPSLGSTASLGGSGALSAAGARTVGGSASLGGSGGLLPSGGVVVELQTGDPFTAAWREAQASAPANVVELYTLEMHHPSFGGEAIRMVRDTQDHMLLLEAFAPLDAGETVLFTGVPFEVPWPGQEEGTVPELTIRIDNIGREIMPFMPAAVTSFTAITVIFRVYLFDMVANTKVSGIDPISFPLRSVTITDTYVEGTASPADLANLRAMRLVYDLTNYPGMGV